MSNLTITLAGNPYTVGQFILKQIRDIAVTLAGMFDPVENSVARAEGIWSRKLSTIQIALRSAYPGINVEDIEAMSITAAEINAAYDQILVFAGLVPKPEDAAKDKPVVEAA